MFNGIHAWKDPSLVGKKKSYKCVHLLLCNPINLKELRDKFSQNYNLVRSHNAAVTFRDTATTVVRTGNYRTIPNMTLTQIVDKWWIKYYQQTHLKWMICNNIWMFRPITTHPVSRKHGFHSICHSSDRCVGSCLHAHRVERHTCTRWQCGRGESHQEALQCHGLHVWAFWTALMRAF